jgi:hypothetical protein
LLVGPKPEPITNIDWAADYGTAVMKAVVA